MGVIKGQTEIFRNLPVIVVVKNGYIWHTDDYNNAHNLSVECMYITI